MNHPTLNLVLQVIMLTGLFLIFLSLAVPLAMGYFASPAKAAERTVLEISDSRSGSRQRLFARANRLLQDNPAMQIEIVARDKGINLVTNHSAHRPAVLALQKQGVRFTACDISLQRLIAESQSPIELLPGVQLIADGQRFAEQLRDEGYTDELV